MRGATTVDIDGSREICEATGELLTQLLRANGLDVADVISLWLTVTPDLRSEFPARGARDVGWGDVPIMCAQEIDVPGAPRRCIRALVHVQLPERSVGEGPNGSAGARPGDSPLRSVYLRGARELRPDRAFPPGS
jgi:chorismate mutase